MKRAGKRVQPLSLALALRALAGKRVDKVRASESALAKPHAAGPS